METFDNPITGLEPIVDRAIVLNKKIKELTKELDDCKEQIRILAEKNIEIDGTSIKVAGTRNNFVTVVISNKRKVVVESKFKPETLPLNIREKFFVEVSSYIPVDVDIFEKNLNDHPEFDDKFQIIYNTPHVRF